MNIVKFIKVNHRILGKVVNKQYSTGCVWLVISTICDCILTQRDGPLKECYCTFKAVEPGIYLQLATQNVA